MSAWRLLSQRSDVSGRGIEFRNTETYEILDWSKKRSETYIKRATTCYCYHSLSPLSLARRNSHANLYSRCCQTIGIERAKRWNHSRSLCKCWMENDARILCSPWLSRNTSLKRPAAMLMAFHSTSTAHHWIPNNRSQRSNLFLEPWWMRAWTCWAAKFTEASTRLAMLKIWRPRWVIVLRINYASQNSFD